MSERAFRGVIGALLLAALYFDWHPLLWGLVAVMIIEAVTNWRIPLLLNRAFHGQTEPAFPDSSELLHAGNTPRFGFEAERAWRLTVVAILILTVYPLNDVLWFFPWFMGFAILGAGISGVCPVLISLKLLGFR